MDCNHLTIVEAIPENKGLLPTSAHTSTASVSPCTFTTSSMTTAELVAEEALQERLRLWRTEKGPDVTTQYQDMQLQNDARLGRFVRGILLRKPTDGEQPRDFRAKQLHEIKKACQDAEREDDKLKNVLHEGVEVGAARIKDLYVSVALEHPDELDPINHVNEQLRKPIGPVAYCSPVLRTLLFAENFDKVPASKISQAIELDLPDRVDSLLEFHHIAFHADVAVMAQLYDPILATDKLKRRELLKLHQAKMEKLSVEFSDNITARLTQHWEQCQADIDDAAFSDTISSIGDYASRERSEATSSAAHSSSSDWSRNLKRPFEHASSTLPPSADSTPKGILRPANPSGGNTGTAQERPNKRATILDHKGASVAGREVDSSDGLFFLEHRIAPENLSATVQAAYDLQVDRDPNFGIRVTGSEAEGTIQVPSTPTSTRQQRIYEFWTPPAIDRDAQRVPRSFASGTGSTPVGANVQAGRVKAKAKAL
ncbi:hypothetical protein MIND_01359000 [Mycena indigotica]|uniref:Uncharacterized protein n=1 Tax=Mycena indigotica TaxID=2126181 RepID=A0A8H6VRZ6_9AGAR|nr:uncharacterized protein MIND_01359000 [Mycena indigotica]KAF7289846.1 hypothetical protein MIND_01359000 [Mycena indigotica]